MVANFTLLLLISSQRNNKKLFDRLKVIMVKKPVVKIFMAKKPVVKIFMAKKPVVKIFNPKKDVTLTTDASEYSIYGILSLEGLPIMYLSRRLTNTEFNYSNMEKEALAIVWTTSRARQFLTGKNSFEKWFEFYIQEKNHPKSWYREY